MSAPTNKDWNGLFEKVLLLTGGAQSVTGGQTPPSNGYTSISPSTGSNSTSITWPPSAAKAEEATRLTEDTHLRSAQADFSISIGPDWSSITFRIGGDVRVMSVPNKVLHEFLNTISAKILAETVKNQ